MNATSRQKIFLLAGLFTLCCSMACAQRRFHRVHHIHSHPAHRVLSIVTPSVTAISTTTNLLTQKERLQLAIAYIEKHGSLTAKEYSQITDLKREVASSELEAFAMDKHNPIQVNYVKKKKLFKLRYDPNR